MRIVWRQDFVPSGGRPSGAVSPDEIPMPRVYCRDADLYTGLARRVRRSGMRTVWRQNVGLAPGANPLELSFHAPSIWALFYIKFSYQRALFETITIF